MKQIKTEIYNDNFQNFKRYGIQKAQLVIADIPYNVGTNFYGSNPMWYKGGDNKNGESKLAGKAAFNTDFNFNIAEYFHFCNRLLKKEPKQAGGRGRSSDAPCMIVFCAFEQLQLVIQYAKKHGFKNYIPLTFIKNFSPQVLKANMRVVGATEYALVLYRDKLPKFRNGLQVDENGKNIQGTGRMVFNWFNWEKDGKDIPKIHPAQKPVAVLKKLIETFTDEGDIVIDPCCGSGSSLRAARELNRNSYGFEISKEFYRKAKDEMLKPEKKIVHEYADMDKAVSDGWCNWFTQRAEFLIQKSYVTISPKKAATMTARQFESWNGNFVFEWLEKYIVPFDKTLKILDKEVERGKIGYFNKDSQGNRVYYIHDKAVTLCGEAGGVELPKWGSIFLVASPLTE